MKLLVNYEKDGRPLEELTDEDQFVLRFGKIPRLKQRINTFTFMGNFPDTVKRLQPVGLPKSSPTSHSSSSTDALILFLFFLLHPQQLNSIIAASMSIKSSTKLKKILEVRRRRRGDILRSLLKCVAFCKGPLTRFLSDRPRLRELHEQQQEGSSVRLPAAESRPCKCPLFLSSFTLSTLPFEILHSVAWSGATISETVANVSARRFTEGEVTCKPCNN